MAHLTIPILNIPYTGHSLASIGLMQEQNLICIDQPPFATSQFEGFLVEEIEPYFRRTAEPDSCPVTLREAPYWVKDVIVNKGLSELINQDSPLKAEITELITRIQNGIPGLGISTPEMMNFISFPYFLYTEGETVKSFHAHLKRIDDHLGRVRKHIEQFRGDFDIGLRFYQSYLECQDIIRQALENHEEILILANFGLPFLPPELKALSFIKHITLDNNDLTEFPKEILGFEKLMGIYMRDNLLKQIPKELTQFKSLILADFDKNLIKPGAKVPKGVQTLFGDYKFTLESRLHDTPEDLKVEKKKVSHIKRSSAY